MVDTELRKQTKISRLEIFLTGISIKPQQVKYFLDFLPNDENPAHKTVLVDRKLYKIIELIGKGGMGIVYKAKDLSTPKDAVALKFPNPKKMDKGSLDALIHEANLLKGMNEKNIINIEKIGYTYPGNIPCIIMEYIDSGSLQDLIDKHKYLEFGIPSVIAAYTLSRIARGCRKIYNKLNIIHRDFDPGNILISDGDIVITDLGIAVIEGSEDASYLEGFAGKPAFAAPEQISVPFTANGSIDPDIRVTSDIFTIGLVGYMMMTLKNPYEIEDLYDKKTPKDTEEAEKRKIKLLETTSQLHKKDLIPADEVVEHCDQELAKIINKAMNHDQKNRYQTPEELETAIRVNYFGKKGISLPKPSLIKAYVDMIQETYDKVLEIMPKLDKRTSQGMALNLRKERVKLVTEIVSKKPEYAILEEDILIQKRHTAKFNRHYLLQGSYFRN